MRRYDVDLVRLKTPSEQVREIDKQLEGLNYVETRARWEYEERLRAVKAKRERLEEEKRLLLDQIVMYGGATNGV